MRFFVLSVFLVGIYTVSFAQTTVSTGAGELPVTSAVPFLRIIPDARSGAMGDVGVATKPDVYSLYHNPAKLAFVGLGSTDRQGILRDDLGVAFSYVPWLRTLVNDIYMAHLTGYKRIGKMQTLGASFRYFSMGNITFTDINGLETGQFRPNEFAIDAAYSRILAKGFSTGFALRFIYSNLAAGQQSAGVTIKPGIAAAADISFYYNKDIDVKGKNSNFGVGLNLSNIGSKITYTESSVRDFIPMNFGLGVNYLFDFDEHNQFNVAIDLNRLMVPTPVLASDEDGNENPEYDADNNGVADYREKSVPAALFGSFGDAPGGFAEEMRENTYSIGLEYWYDQLFAVRAGYFHEHQNKGNRRFFTVGVGLRYNVLGLDFSYLVPTGGNANRSPLDNTLRISLLVNFQKVGTNKEAKPVE